MRNSKIIFFLLIIFFLHPTYLSAQVPLPYVGCNKTDDPEFNSLRPYQASPCNLDISETALSCGNNLTIKDEIEAYKNEAKYCQDLPNGKIQCFFSKNFTKNIAVDLSNANFPIMGNTELVKNSQSPTEILDDVTKVNEYVSWYLNGVTNRAEYGDTKNTDYETVNLSGPLKKLLPSVIQDAERTKTINKAGSENHNQIVVCSESNIPLIGNILNLGKFKSVSCYKGDGSSANGFLGLEKEVNRLDNWDGDLSIWNRYLEGIYGNIIKLLPDIPEDIIRNSVLNHWNSRKPPLPWDIDPNDPKDDQKQMTGLEYRKYYNEWRGKTCVIIPLINYLACFENIFVPNKYADLFPYVPLSSTEDRRGEVEVQEYSVQPESNDMKIYNVEVRDQKPAELFFAHMQESAELGQLLQKTYNPQGNPETGNSNTPSQSGGCNLTNIRSNPGDDLFAGETKATVSYSTDFSCEFESKENIYTVNVCKKNVTVNLSTISKTPKADEVWSRLVAGPSAVFKRIFPKIGPNSAVEYLLDLPAASGVNYTTGEITTPAEIYFPHIGGVSEYFLKGIQTALRPKGYGETIASGQSQPSSSGNCSLGTGPCSVENLLPFFDNSVDKATKASIICNKESGSNPMAKNDGCLTGSSCDYSIGLFQINLLAHCAGAFSSYSCQPNPISCTVGNQNILQTCETRLSIPVENTLEAVRISSNGTNWGPWSAATVCGIN